MNPRVTEFQCIMPLENIPSVLKLGILSNERSAKIEHRSVAMEDVQEKREQKHVPGGLKLHQYANLYFHARNPMLYKRKSETNNLCVLRVSTEILQLPGVVFADCNASSPRAFGWQAHRTGRALRMSCRAWWGWRWYCSKKCANG